MKTRRAGFTLIELLTVIAIIGILAAIVIPVVGAVRGKARSAQCVSNLRQIAAGLLLFTQDHRGRFPQAGVAIAFDPQAPTTSGPKSWIEQVYPYTGRSAEVFRCEDAATVLPGNARWSYFIGSHAAFAQSGTLSAVVLDRIQLPSRHILAGDATYGFAEEDADKDDFTQDAAFTLRPAPIHGGKVNLAFVDGHVESAAAFDAQRFAIRYSGVGHEY
jgi:prepilin-type N-terminal cleavage/methylation domain-containing protein/prepilin-type processing-associated H-X9-DG protein